MSTRYWILIAGILSPPAPYAQSAQADIVNTHGQKMGMAQLRPSDSGVETSVAVTQLPPGTYGIHIHNLRKCEGPDFTTAGPHFNPTSKKHGRANPEGPHAGDLLNVEVKADGTGEAVLVDPAVTLQAGANSLFHEGGTAIIVHAGADDYKTDPSGNSGARIACGAIAAPRLPGHIRQ